MVYSVVTSWLYPTESGRDVCSWDFENKKEAVADAEELCREEKENFEKVTGCDAFDPEPVSEYSYFFIITPKNGLDEWFFSAEVVELAGFKLRSTKKEEEGENAAELPPGVTFTEIDEAIDSLVEDGSIEKEDVEQVHKMARDMVRKMRRKERHGNRGME